MARTGLTGSGGTYRCPHCGALYAVTVRSRPAPSVAQAVCDICQRVMKSWHSTLFPEHRLLRSPDAHG